MRMKILIIYFFVFISIAFSDSHVNLIKMYKYVIKASSILIDNRYNKEFYAPWKVIDGDLGTAWVEGKDNEGIGEYIIIKIGHIGNIKYFEIMPGISMNSKLFYSNNRLKCIEVIIYEDYSEFNDKSLLKYNKVYNKQYYKLKDIMEYQKFEINNIETVYKQNENKSLEELRMKIVIKEIYKGKKYNDTGISEIRLLDENGNDITKIFRDTWSKY